VIILISITLLLQSHTVQEDFCTNAYDSLEEVLSQSKYAAIYFVKSYEKIGYIDKYQNHEKYEYVLRRNGDISYNSPETIKIIGRQPYDIVPSVYFRLNYNHKKLILENDISWGLASSTTPHKKGKCNFYPRFVVEEGFSYLILGGVDNPIEAEPILHPKDPWQEFVKTYFLNKNSNK